MEHSAKKVFITGIDGFTGKHLEEYLEKKGFIIYGIVINNPLKKNHFACDIRDAGKLKKIISDINPDYIIHLAAISFTGEKNKLLMYDINVLGTQNLFDAIIKSGIKPLKIVIASSAVVYGNSYNSPIEEQSQTIPNNHYGYSKLITEKIALNYFNKYNIVITRPFNYTGVGQPTTFLIPKIIDHFVKGAQLIELGNTRAIREFNNVKDIVHLYWEILKHPSKNYTINLCSGREIKIMDLIDLMEIITDRKIDVKINPGFIRPNEAKYLIGSDYKLKSFYDYSFKYDISQTLNEMYNCIKQ